MSPPVPLGAFSNSSYLPLLIDIAAKVNPMPYTDPQLANEKSPHHYPCHCLYYLQRTLAQCSQLSAQCATVGLVINLRLPVQKAFKPNPNPSACSVVLPHLSYEYCGCRLHSGLVGFDK